MIKEFKRRMRERILSVITESSSRTLTTFRLDTDLVAKSAHSVKVAQRSLFHQYRTMAKAGSVPSIDDSGYRVYSQFDEDGMCPLNNPG